MKKSENKTETPKKKAENKEVVVVEEVVIPEPDPCGVCRDINGRFIGKYVYLSGEADQPKLEALCEALLATYKADNNFYISVDLECLAPDSLVTTSDGDIVELGSLSEGAPILGSSLDKKNGLKAHVVKTSNLVNKGIKHCYTLAPKYGLPITGSDNHAFLTQAGWKLCKDITTEDYLFVNRKITDYPENTSLTDKELALLGWFIAEGCRASMQDGSVNLSIVEEEYLEWVEMNANPSLETSWKRNGNNSTTLKISTGGRNKSGSYVKNPAKTLLVQHGLFNKYSWEKEIPSAVLKSSNRQISLLLRCLFTGDGTVMKDKVGISYTTTSKRLAEQLSILLSRFGIISSVHSREDKRKDSYKSTYSLTVLGEDAVLFYNKIGFLGRKNCELSASISRAEIIQDKSRFPKQASKVITDILANGLTPHYLATGYGIRIFSPWYGHSTYTFKTIEAILDVKNIPTLKELYSMYHSTDFILSPIREITDAGFQEVVDVTVDTHQFIANNCVVHNTQGLDYFGCQILLWSVSWNGRHAVVFSPFFLWGSRTSEGSGRAYELWCEVLRTIPINNQATKFDAKFIYQKQKILINILFCTLTAAHLGYAGAFPGDRFALDAITKNLLKPLDISKQQQKSFIGQPVDQQFTNDQVAYAASDTLIVHRLKPELEKRLRNQNLWHIWEDIERPCVNALIKSEHHGVLTNVELLNERYMEKLTEVKDLENKMQEIYLAMPEDKRPKVTKGVFNPNAWQQILNVMAARGLKLPGTGMDDLEEARIDFPDEMLDLVIAHKKLYTRYIKLYQKWIGECINPETNCIHPTFYTCGAWQTGRVACVHSKTEVITDKGLVPILDLSVGEDVVKTHTGEFNTVTDLIYQGEQELFEIELENGEKLLCTQDHRLLVNGQWVYLEDLKEGGVLDVTE